VPHVYEPVWLHCRLVTFATLRITRRVLTALDLPRYIPAHVTRFAGCPLICVDVTNVDYMYVVTCQLLGRFPGCRCRSRCTVGTDRYVDYALLRYPRRRCRVDVPQLRFGLVAPLPGPHIPHTGHVVPLVTTFTAGLPVYRSPLNCLRYDSQLDIPHGCRLPVAADSY